jgi:hypothetical protein
LMCVFFVLDMELCCAVSSALPVGAMPQSLISTAKLDRRFT